MTGISGRVGDILGASVEAKLLNRIAEFETPQHLAVIMDGNRRFAWSKAVSTAIGHRKGKEKLEQVMDWVLELEIPFLTVYALSTENLENRKGEELDTLFDLYAEGLDDIRQDARIHDRGVKVSVIGRRELLPQRVRDSIDRAEAETADYENFTFTICLAYGSREEMVEAIRGIAADHAAGNLPLESIDQREVSRRLYTGDIPDPDLVIRTSGEERISNFLLWQAAYSELYFTDVFWPSFGKRDFLKAIIAYQNRKRRFGE
ncbi:MAG TPA: di-trans,poly-cis-decaprenylcistransferase [Candidatus Poseidoniales archaeon]|nr:di-trans,poly-cis-decaprenylcistransferase [Candidatus Poseidoniales archaeon]HIO94686.1 di-trans,poly-cis-decaprenylcistransferase [Candidatus Poseidoniales archaeon]